MNEHKASNISSLGPDDRYSYFIRHIVDFGEVWGLYQEGWALAADDDKQQAIPFWPEEYFADMCSIGVWKGYVPQAIKLKDFIEKWLPGMQKDGMLAAIFQNARGQAMFISPLKILEDIQAALTTS